MALPTTNLVGRYKANTGVTSAGTPLRVSQWNDQSGLGNHLTQATSASQPWYANDFQGNPIVRLPTHDDAKTAATAFLNIPTGITINAKAMTVWVVHTGVCIRPESLIWRTSGVAGEFRWVNNGMLSVNNSNTSTFPHLINKQVSGIVFGATTANYYNTYASQSKTGATTSTATGGFLGQSGAGAQPFCGDIYEVLIYSAAQSAQDQADTLAYLQSTYGTVTSARSKQIVFEGDSITFGFEVGQNRTYPVQVNEQAISSYGSDAWRMTVPAVSGSTVTTLNSRWSTITNTFYDATIARNVLWVKIGTNDLTTDTAATFYSNLTTYVQTAIAAGWEVWVATIIATPNSANQTKTDAANDMIRGVTGNGIIVDAGASKVVDLAKDAKFDSGSTVSDTAYYQSSSDGHPSILGDTRIANMILPYLGTSGVTVTGPSTGLAGFASTNFTVAFPSAGTFTGSQTAVIAVASGFLTATATGTITNNNSTSVTVQPSDGQSSFTFTFTPASTGSNSITYSNGQGWSNPANTSYTATTTIEALSGTIAGSTSATGSLKASVPLVASTTAGSGLSGTTKAKRSCIPLILIGASGMMASLAAKRSCSAATMTAASEMAASLRVFRPTVPANPMPPGIPSTVYPSVTINGTPITRISQTDQTCYQCIDVPTFERPVTVTLTSPYTNSEIRYKLDGKMPGLNSPVYSEPLVFKQNSIGDHTAIRARIYDKRDTSHKGKVIRVMFRIVPPR